MKQVLVENRISHPAYESLVTKLNNRERLPPDLGPVERFANDPGEMSVAAEQAKLPVNQQQLKAAWDCSGVASKQDWLDWIKRLNTELMRESPSQAIRASRNLADKLPSFAREMFNVAFVSCWTELYEQYQDDLVHNIELAFTNPQVPPDVVSVILNLAEFMEHDEKPLAIESRLLGDYAVIFHHKAKALHYKELEFFVDASGGVVEDLISINQKLQQTDAAWGTLEYAQENMEMTDDVMWYEKLGRWEEALNVWTQRRDRGDSDFTEDRIAHGQLSAFHALGEWEQLADLVQVRWSSATNEEKKIMAPLAAAASWSMNQWDLMDDYIAAMKSDSADRNFFRAILQVHRNQYSQALKSIGRAREKLDPELTSLTSESYGRAYE
jgi:FKBP12-rapamycin complex-associated protein